MAPALLLVAASGLAREVLAVLRAHPTHEVLGFLDDDPALHGTTVDGLPVLGPIEAALAHPDAQLLVCAGRGAGRAAIVGRLDALGVPSSRYATLVHPGVEVPAGCVVGAGSIVLAGVVLTAGVSIAAHVVVMPHATLTHDCQLGDFATVCAGVALGGSVVLGRACYLGMNASVREHVRVGAGAVLGMGAVLLADQPDDSTWVGVPARPLGASTGRARHHSDPLIGAVAAPADEGADAR